MVQSLTIYVPPEPHEFEPDPALAGLYCQAKGCRYLKANAVHSREAITKHTAQLAAAQARIHEAQERHRHMTGER